MEQINISSQLVSNIKTVEIKEGENKYKCQIQIIKNFIQVSLYIDNILKSQGNIHISKIQYQIYALADYTINEIFEEINILNNDNFNIIKDNNNKYKLKIKFIILRKNKYLYIDLIENEQNINNNDLINTITELKEIIKNKDQKIKLLEDELNKYKSINNNDNTYNNFNIQLKEPIHKLNYHTSTIYCSTVLKDGRFVTGYGDGSIIIYNNKTFKPDLTIKEHSNSVYCIIQLRSGILVSGSADKTIKLYDINGNEYKVIQTLTYHTNGVTKIIELKNNKLVSCSKDKSIIFYFKDNNEYIKDYSISTNGENGPVIQAKDNEICFYEDTNSALCFYDLLERKIITKINNISVSYYILDSLVMMTKDLLLATGENKLSIININLHNIIRTIDVSGSSSIYCACMLNENMLLTGDDKKIIRQWRIEDDNLILISKKEKAHDDAITDLLNLGNGHIASGSWDKTIKIW